MYKNILVPIDGSAPAIRGLDEAIRLASVHGARLRLVHVLDHAPLASPDITGSRFDKIFEALRDDGMRLLASAEARVRKAGVAVDSRLVDTTDGAPGGHITLEAANWPADVIVCGTHGRRGLRRAVLGSTAEEILRQSPIPVLLVPERIARA